MHCRPRTESSRMYFSIKREKPEADKVSKGAVSCLLLPATLGRTTQTHVVVSQDLVSTNPQLPGLDDFCSNHFARNPRSSSPSQLHKEKRPGNKLGLLIRWRGHDYDTPAVASLPSAAGNFRIRLDSKWRLQRVEQHHIWSLRVQYFVSYRACAPSCPTFLHAAATGKGLDLLPLREHNSPQQSRSTHSPVCRALGSSAHLPRSMESTCSPCR
jgi:hypothetical protein